MSYPSVITTTGVIKNPSGKALQNGKILNFMPVHPKRGAGLIAEPVEVMIGTSAANHVSAQVGGRVSLNVGYPSMGGIGYTFCYSGSDQASTFYALDDTTSIADCFGKFLFAYEDGGAYICVGRILEVTYPMVTVFLIEYSDPVSVPVTTLTGAFLGGGGPPTGFPGGGTAGPHLTAAPRSGVGGDAIHALGVWDPVDGMKGVKVVSLRLFNVGDNPEDKTPVPYALLYIGLADDARVLELLKNIVNEPPFCRVRINGRVLLSSYLETGDFKSAIKALYSSNIGATGGRETIEEAESKPLIDPALGEAVWANTDFGLGGLETSEEKHEEEESSLSEPSRAVRKLFNRGVGGPETSEEFYEREESSLSEPVSSGAARKPFSPSPGGPETRRGLIEGSSVAKLGQSEEGETAVEESEDPGLNPRDQLAESMRKELSEELHTSEFEDEVRRQLDDDSMDEEMIMMTIRKESKILWVLNKLTTGQLKKTIILDRIIHMEDQSEEEIEIFANDQLLSDDSVALSAYYSSGRSMEYPLVTREKKSTKQSLQGVFVGSMTTERYTPEEKNFEGQLELKTNFCDDEKTHHIQGNDYFWYHVNEFRKSVAEKARDGLDAEQLHVRESNGGAIDVHPRDKGPTAMEFMEQNWEANAANWDLIRKTVGKPAKGVKIQLTIIDPANTDWPSTGLELGFETSTPTKDRPEGSSPTETPVASGGKGDASGDASGDPSGDTSGGSETSPKIVVSGDGSPKTGKTPAAKRPGKRSTPGRKKGRAHNRPADDDEDGPIT